MKALNYTEIKKEKLSLSRANREIVFVLDSLQSKDNLAHVCRLCDSLRIKTLYAYNIRKELFDHHVDKKSRSTLRHLEILHFSEAKELDKKLYGIKKLALEWTDHSQSIYDFIYKKPIALILGNEKNGIASELLELCDQSLHIPMYGQNSSMNAAMSLAIASYHILHV